MLFYRNKKIKNCRSVRHSRQRAAQHSSESGCCMQRTQTVAAIPTCNDCCYDALLHGPATVLDITKTLLVYAITSVHWISDAWWTLTNVGLVVILIRVEQNSRKTKSNCSFYSDLKFLNTACYKTLRRRLHLTETRKRSHNYCSSLGCLLAVNKYWSPGKSKILLKFFFTDRWCSYSDQWRYAVKYHDFGATIVVSLLVGC